MQKSFTSNSTVKKMFQYDKKIPLHLGTLSRQNALLCLGMQSQLDKLLNTNSYINKQENNPRYHPSKLALVLAVSGGIDSISMLAMFVALQKKFPIDLYVAHLNHSIRPESDDEKILVEKLCDTLNVTFHYKKVDIPNFAYTSHIGLEEAARLKRYQFLEEIREKTHAHYICTAHHADDLAEDVLMRLCRGAAWPALGGMQEICTQRKILRPLLQENKKELIRFAHELNLPFAVDKSNEDQLFLRNRVRKTILPLFLSENPSFLDSIKHLHTCAQRDSLFFQEYINEFWKTVKIIDETINIPLENFKDIPEAMRFRVYIHALSILGKGYTQHNTLEKLDNAIMYNKGKGNCIFKFTQGARAKIFQNTLIFY